MLSLADIDWNWLLKNPDFALFAFLGFMAVLVVGVLVAVYRQKALEVQLKERMIERGFTAEEIVAVINAGQGRHPSRGAPTRVQDSTRQPDCGPSQ